MKAYTDADRQLALSALDSCRGDYRQASRWCKIPAALIKRWAEQAARGPFQAIASGRPQPPPAFLDDLETLDLFEPSPELQQWAVETFIEGDGPLVNPAHEHLQSARLGFIWTNVANARNMRAVAGTAEIPNVQGDKWTRGRMFQQLREWFGSVPDFLITLYAPYAAQCSDASFCALSEHEIYHCGQAVDMFGGPRFDREGRPVFSIKGHDAEEHVGIVRRYGVGNAAGGVAELVAAAQLPPLLSTAEIDFACGTCRK